MLRKIHFMAAISAFLTITIFFTSTIIVELFGSEAAVATVKEAIVCGLFLLIPTIAATGATGIKLGEGSTTGIIGRKRKRMMVIAANGILILAPAAIYLRLLASSGSFGMTFYAVQAAELLAGAANIGLMCMNIRDGLLMTGRFRNAKSWKTGSGMS